MPTTEPAPVVIQANALLEFAIRAFEAVGVSHEDAYLLADSMVQTALWSEGDHGMRLVPLWVARIKLGGIDLHAQIEVIKEGRATALLDAHHGIGQVGAKYAMELAVKKAREAGVALVGVRNSNAYAGAKYFPLLALPHRMIGFTISLATPLVAPPGGVEAKTGTNPIAIAVPTSQGFPVVLDMSTSAAAFERLRMYATRGEPLPDGLAIDLEGKPLHDARELEEARGFLKGGVPLPAGGCKGFGLSVMFNLLTGVLLGSAFLEGIHLLLPDGQHEHKCYVVGAINIEHFMPYDQFVVRVDSFVRDVKDCRLATGVERISMMGERGLLWKEERLKNGVPVDAPTVDALKAMAQELGIPGIPGKI